MPRSKSKHPNAQKHAVFSKFLILPGEDPRQFDKLIDEVADEWQPEGKSEHDAALDIAKGMWLKRRVQLFLMIEGMKNAGDPNHPSFDERIRLQFFLAYAELNPETAFFHGKRFIPKELLDAFIKQFPRTDVNILVATPFRHFYGVKCGMARSDEKRNYFAVAII
jgi:hypothetical protein